MWPLLYLPKGKTKYEKLDYGSADLAALFKELAGQEFCGSVEIVSPVQRGLFVWNRGALYSAFYDGDDEQDLSGLDVVRHFMKKKKHESDTVVNVTELDSRLVDALSALKNKPPLYRELETGFIDMAKLFETFTAKRFAGVLRFYHVRSHTRLGNILIKMNKITRDQLQQAVRLQLSRQGALRLGDALVQIGALAPEDLGSALDLQSHARKGSDIELALAVFWEGDFLGGFSHIHKQFKTGRDEILPQLVGTEVLMDIIEGQPPEPMDLASVWTAPGADAHAPAREAAPEINPYADDGFHLKADDLILEMAPEHAPAGDDFLTMVDDVPEAAPAISAESEPAAAPEKPTEVVAGLVEPPAPVTAAEQPVVDPAELLVLEPIQEPEPLVPESTRLLQDPVVSAATAGIAPELVGLEYLVAVARKFMGPVGTALLKKEASPLPLFGREWPENQVRDLAMRFFRSAGWVLGRRRSEAMLQQIRERIEV